MTIVSFNDIIKVETLVFLSPWHRLRNGISRASLDSLSDFSEKLDTITGRLGCTKNHAIREFHASYGVSPYEYLQRRRFALAKALLRNTAMSVTEIAERLGFWDVHYFSGSFKRRFGKTPREYRGAQER